MAMTFGRADKEVENMHGIRAPLDSETQIVRV